MPTCFKFVRADGTSPTLQEIDTMICKEAGLRDDPKQWSYLYQAITLAGLAIATKYQEVNAETFAKYEEEQPEAFYDYLEWSIARKFLVTDFTYTAWYQSR